MCGQIVESGVVVGTFWKSGTVKGSWDMGGRRMSLGPSRALLSCRDRWGLISCWNPDSAALTD